MASDTSPKPRVGIPYRTRNEELKGERGKYDKYREAVLRAGGEPVEVSLGLSAEELRRLAGSLDAVVLTGSPADVNPSLYGAPRNPASAEADPDRERTDFALLEHAFAEHKPVLAICYGVQSMNVFLGGTLIQDIPSELHTPIQHPWSNRDKGAPEPFHAAKIESGSRLRELAGADEVGINSSHHQSDPRSRPQPAHCCTGSGRSGRSRRMDGRLELGHWRSMASGADGRDRICSRSVCLAP